MTTLTAAPEPCGPVLSDHFYCDNTGDASRCNPRKLTLTPSRPSKSVSNFSFFFFGVVAVWGPVFFFRGGRFFLLQDKLKFHWYYFGIYKTFSSHFGRIGKKKH